jgi:hypothetical protein
MELIMALHTEHERFSASGNHDFLPCFLAILHVRELFQGIHLRRDSFRTSMPEYNDAFSLPRLR